jgi:hypothetical protein
MLGAATSGTAMLGAGTAIIGLTPLLPISVAPSGMVDSPTVGGDSETEPLADDASDPDAQLPDVVAPIIPPPSKVDAPLGVPTADIDDEPVVQLVSAAWLKPPGSSSVAPSGMVAPELAPIMPPEPGIPSGDVAPIAGVPGALCA